ncbi:MAG: hypothetical protein ACTSRL_03070 [Candidatus Helarchaeota archaeon]
MPMIDIYSEVSKLSVYKLHNLIAQLGEMYLFIQKVNVKNTSYYLMVISRSKEIGPLIENILPEFVIDLGTTLEGFFLAFQNI